MNKIPLPTSFQGEKVAASLDSIISYDQWDDWVPDVVYLGDVAESKGEYVAEIEGLRRRGSISLEQAYACEIYSNGDLTGVPFRYILIPGGTTARTAKIIDWNNYAAVKAYLGLKD